jgi:ubiquitin-activating enzyme E1
VKIAETDAEAKAQAEGGGSSGGSSLDVDSQAEHLIASLPSPASLTSLKLVSLDFDKDLDDHMHVVAAASNLRARNYKIPEADLHKSRQIAGKIIPAIATTTALVTGLVCLELYKVVQKKPLDSLKNAFVNLALPLFTFSEPQPPAHQTAVVKGEEWKWSAWDRIEIEGDLTLREFLKYMEDQYGLSVSMLSHGVSILYSFFASKRTVEQRMPMKLSEVVAAVTKKPLPDSKKFLILEIIVSDKDTGEEKEVPFVRVRCVGSRGRTVLRG